MPRLRLLNKPADAGVLLRVNSPVNCKEAVHTARITEGVEEDGLGEVPKTAGSGHVAAVPIPAYKEGVRARSKNFLAFSGKPVEELTEEDVRNYVLHLMAGSLSKETINTYQAAIRFFFGVTLNKAINYLQMPRLKEDRSLPEIFSREEVSLVLTVCRISSIKP